MRKTAFHRITLIVLISAILLLGWASVEAQGENLLTNPGFEDPYPTFDGAPVRRVANGWVPWHVLATADMPTFQNAQPEYAPAAPDRARIRNGNNAQLYFSFFATHDGGIYQRVTGITSGTEMRFSVYAYVWSSTFTDVELSEEDGDVLLQVGIDPTGGTDGESNAIVWSTLIEQYDAYREYSVITTANSSAVTVFVRSTVGFPVQNSHIYLDDAVLAQTTGSAPVIETEESEPTETTVPSTNTVEPTDTSSPPTNTPLPASDTPVPPTDIPESTDTPVLPSDTPVPAVEVTKDDIGIILPTDTEEPIVVPPTETPLPTATAVPSDTPVPTATPIPTETQEPSPTQEVPTDGIIPTATLVRLPTATPVGGDVAPISDTFPGTIIHTVRAGDTVGELATLYGSSTGAIIEANGLNSSALIFRGQGLVIPVRLAAPATSTPTATPVVVVVTATLSPPPDNIYVVQPGDTLTRIALRFNTTVATLAQLNGIVNANQIQVGQRIAVPVPEVAAPDAPSVAAPVTIEPVTYVVQPGDNLFRIALRFGVSMQQLAIENGIVNMNRVFIGQVLVIPV